MVESLDFESAMLNLRQLGCLFVLLFAVSGTALAQETPEMVKDITPGAGWSNVKHVVDVNGIAFFDALARLWRSDGTSSGTFEVRSDVSPHGSTAQQYMPA